MLEKRCKIKEKVVSSALNFAHYLRMKGVFLWKSCVKLND